MTLTVGRAALGNSVDLATVGRSGDDLALEGTFFPTVTGDTDEADAVRLQLAGLVENRDEPVVPITFTVDPKVNGWYAIDSVSTRERPSSAEIGAFAYSISARRVAKYASPLIEIDSTSVVRTNGVGITATEVEALGAWWHESAQSIPAGNPLSRDSSDGPVYATYLASPFSVLARSYPTPANRYLGSARLEVLYGSTWFPVVGDQVPLTAAANWRLGNGIIRVSPITYTGAFGATHYGIRLEAWNQAAGAWQTVVDLKHGEFTGGAFDDQTQWGIAESFNFNGGTRNYSPMIPKVVRNSPETVTIGFDTVYGITQYLSIDAIATTLSFTVSRPAGASVPFLRPVGTETGATLGGSAPYTGNIGVVRSAADANGNIYMILNALAGWTASAGGLYLPSVAAGTPYTFGIGVSKDPSAISRNGSLLMAGQWLCRAAWRERVVAT